MNSILFLFFISWVNRKWTIKIFGKFKKLENFKPGFLWWVSDHYWWRHLWSVCLGKRITETIIWIVFEVFFHFHNSLRLFWMISHKIWVLIKYERFQLSKIILDLSSTRHLTMNLILWFLATESELVTSPVINTPFSNYGISFDRNDCWFVWRYPDNNFLCLLSTHCLPVPI